MKLIGWGLVLLAIVITALVPVVSQDAADQQTKENFRAALAGEQPAQVDSLVPWVWAGVVVLLVAGAIVLWAAYMRPRAVRASA